MKETDLIYFEALTDVFLNAIKKKNYPLVRSIVGFYYDEFKKVRVKSIGTYAVYPYAYYELAIPRKMDVRVNKVLNLLVFREVLK